MDDGILTNATRHAREIYAITRGIAHIILYRDNLAVHIACDVLPFDVEHRRWELVWPWGGAHLDLIESPGEVDQIARRALTWNAGVDKIPPRGREISWRIR